MGGTVAEQMVRLGMVNIHLWDFDKVEAHNLANQIFTEQDIGASKTEALERICKEINPAIQFTLHKDGWSEKARPLSGYIFLCVDDIELRQKIVDQNMRNLNIKAMFDFRTMLTGAQAYAADWKDDKAKQAFRKSMNFTHDEATESTPTSACGITLGVVATVRAIVSLGVANFVNFVKHEDWKKFIQLDVFHCVLDAF